MSHWDIVKRYAEAWTKTAEPEIMSTLEGCWTPSSTYTDPLTDTVRGPAALAQVIRDFQEAFPGANLAPTSVLDLHHGFGRFSWRLTLPAPVHVNGITFPKEMDGFDFVEFTADGTRILRVVGFFGPFPQ